MKDQISISRVALLHPKFRNIAITFIEALEAKFGITIRISQGFRTMQEQTNIYAQGRTVTGKIVTWSPAGTSYHNYGLAIDIVVIDLNGQIDWNFDYSKFADVALENKIVWGGTFPKGKTDLDHYENTFGYNWRDLMHKVAVKDFVPGTQYVNI